MSRRSKENLIKDSHAIRQGLMKRIKKNAINSTRHYVLFKESDRGEARLEYYDEKNVAKPRKAYLLRDILSIRSKADGSKHEHVFTIHHGDEIIMLACTNAEEKERWMWDIATLVPYGTDERQARELGCVRAWRVTILPEGLYGIFHFQRCEFILVLNEFTLEIVDPDEHANRWAWRLSYIRNCGFDCQCFLFEAGTRSFSGNGMIWLKMASKQVAREAHRIVLDQMSKGTLPDPDTEARLNTIHGEQKSRVMNLEARYGSQRPRGLSAPAPPLPPSHPNQILAATHHRSRSQCVQSQTHRIMPAIRSQISVPAGNGPHGNAGFHNQRYASDPGHRFIPKPLSPEQFSPDQSDIQLFEPSSPKEPPPIEEGEDDEGIDANEESLPVRGRSHHQRNDSGFFTQQTPYMEMRPTYPGKGNAEKEAAVVQAAKQSQKRTGFGDYEVMNPRQMNRFNSKDSYEEMTLKAQKAGTVIYENHTIKTS